MRLNCSRIFVGDHRSGVEYLLYYYEKRKKKFAQINSESFWSGEKIFQKWQSSSAPSTRIEKVATMKMHDAKVFFFPLAVLFAKWMERFSPMFKRNWTEHKRFFTERKGERRGVQRGSLDGNSLSSSCCFLLSWNNEKEEGP